MQNKETLISNDTPVAMLTVGQLREALGIQSVDTESVMSAEKGKPKQYVYGLAGIRKLFNVSHPTAQKYKDGILRDAVSQRGRVIVVDVEKAMELFNQTKK